MESSYNDSFRDKVLTELRKRARIAIDAKDYLAEMAYRALIRKVVEGRLTDAEQEALSKFMAQTAPMPGTSSKRTSPFLETPNRRRYGGENC
ncbi:MAG: hypothetical protein AAB390_04045 [Patescibacteria group bacterium]